VVVVYGNTVVMGDTLAAAIAQVFGGAAVQRPSGAPSVTVTPQMQSLISQALDLYNKAVAAQKAGDWATYGQLLNQLNGVLKQLNGQP